MKPKKVLIVHHPRGYAVAAAAESKAIFEESGAQVDTMGSMAETGVSKTFYEHTLDAIPHEEYDEVIILGIMLDNRNILHSLTKIEDLAERLEEHGGKLTYIENRGLPANADIDTDNRLLYMLNLVRQHCDFIIRDNAREGAVEVRDSERMVIGAIAARDTDPVIIEQLTPEREKIALGLDLAVRGDYRHLGDLASRFEGVELEDQLKTFFLGFWNDQVLDDELVEAIREYVIESQELKQEAGEKVSMKINELALTVFSRFFVQRSVKELQEEHYEWFLKLAEKKPEFPQVDLSVSLGNLTIVPMTDVSSTWDFRILNEAVNKCETQFGLLLLRAAQGNKYYWEGSDVFTIIKNFCYLDERRITNLFEKEVGDDWRETLMIREISDQGGDTLLFLEEEAEANEMIVACIRSLLSEYELFGPKNGKIVVREKTVDKMLKKSVDMKKLQQYYGGKNHALFTLPRNSAESVEFFCRLMAALVGKEIDENLIPALREVITVYTDILTKASLGMRELSQEYLGESYDTSIEDVSIQMSRAASALLQELFTLLQTSTHPMAKMIKLQKRLKQLDQGVEISSNLIRVLSRDEVSELDLRKIQSLEIKRILVPDLKKKEHESLRNGIMEVIRARFPEGDDRKFAMEMLGDPSQTMTVVLSKKKIVAFYVVGEKNGVYHPDWFMANRRNKKYRGLGEATLMLEFQSDESYQREYVAEAKPKVKICYISLEKLGFIATGDTTGDDSFKERYLRVRREKITKEGLYVRYEGKQLSLEDEEKLRKGCPDFLKPVSCGERLKVIKVKMPEDNEYVLDYMHLREGEEVMTRYIKDPEVDDVYYCVFEPSQELSKAADVESENPPQLRHVG